MEALLALGNEAEWLGNLLLDKKLWPQLTVAISLHFGSEAKLSKAYGKYTMKNLDILTCDMSMFD